MPRRPSGSTAGYNSSTTIASSATRTHKTSDSNVFNGSTQAPSILTTGASVTPQQKMVQVLVTRLKNKLPCNSGVSLDQLEADNATQQTIEALVDLSYDSLDIIAWALSELLERLAKQTDVTGYLPLEVLQSQLFILKVLSVAMSSRWNQNVRSNSRASNHPTSDSPLPPGRHRHPSSEHSFSPPPWLEPTPLDDNCAKYVLSVMVLFLRQTAPTESELEPSSQLIDDDFETIELPGENGSMPAPLELSDMSQHTLRNRPSSNSVNSVNGSVQSSIPIPVRNLSYERTHMTLVKSPFAINTLIAKFAGRIVYHISASNWAVVFHRLRTKIHYLAGACEDKPDTVDLQLMTNSALDRIRLIQVLNELSSLLVNMKPEIQVAVAIPLRVAVWNWIDVFPAEFNDVIVSRGRLEGAPERVFDLLYNLTVNDKVSSILQHANEKLLWPTLTILNCITSERLTSEFHMRHFGYGNVGGQKISSRKDVRFMEDLNRHANSSSKLSGVALVCALDMCRAAMHIRPVGEVPLRLVANDIAHEVKSALWITHTQKPFWDSVDEIDVAMYSAALVTVFRFLSEDQSIPLFLACIEPERSEAVKVCAVKACSTLVTEASRLPWQRSLDPLQTAVAGRLRSIFQTSALRRNELDQYGNMKRAAMRPKSKRTSEQLSDREVMLLGILSLWRSSSAFFLQTLEGPQIEEWIAAAIKLWEAPIDTSIKISTAYSFQSMAEMAFRMAPTDEFHEVVVVWMKRTLPATLISIVTNLIHARTDLECQRLWMAIAHQVLELFCRKIDIEHVKDIQLTPARIPAFALAEIAFLVSLTSADSVVSQSAAKGLRLLAQMERQPGAPVNTNGNEEDRSKRYPIYEQLGDPKVTIVGRVGHQKRIRKLVQLIAYPSATHIAVWEECYWRWRALSEAIMETLADLSEESQNGRHALPPYLEDKHFQWRNLTLYLAAYGGACMQEDDDTPELTSIIPPQFLPDGMRVLKNPTKLVETFVKDLTNLLVVDHMQLREVARDALGVELSPRLHSRLLKHLDDVIRNITENAGLQLTDTYALFFEQFVAVLKLLVEHAQVPMEETLSVNINNTLLALASFIARFNNSTSHRIKIKFCFLCDSVCDNADSLTLRKDTNTRHKTLDIVMDWIKDPANSEEGDSAQRDLNLACLRTAVKLLDRLQLRPLDGTAGDDSGRVVSRLFHQYSENLLKGLDYCQLESPPLDSTLDAAALQQKLRVSQRDAELRELVITGLSHLVSANTESGFKHCLPLAYATDSRKRTIFAHAFARVLSQGTKFDSKDNSAAVARQSRLFELVKGSDMALTMAICETCPAGEVEIMISVLMNLFDTRASLMALMKLMIDREVAHAESDAALFRGNSTCTRFLSAFARIHGYNYLRSLIVPLMKTMASMPPGHAYDIDPNKAGEQDIAQNQANVQIVTSSFLEIVTSSIPALPSMFREICAHLGKSVIEVWPEAKFAALGAFIFLRFISPAVVAPEIVDVEIPKENAIVIRRGLMVIAKIIQNLANNMFFGKEPHMVVLNEYLKAKVTTVTRFLSEVHKYSTAFSDDDADEWLGSTSDDTDSIVLHRFFEKHADKIGKELLSQSQPTVEGDSSAANGKRAWDAVCSTLVELGTSAEVPRRSLLNRQDHREYNDLLSRYAHRTTDSVRDIFVNVHTPKDQPALFVLCISKIDVETLDIELLMCHIFTTLTSPQYDHRDFEVILDCTSITTASEVPLQWVKHCTELIPADIRQRFITTYILNPNQLTQRYLRRWYNFAAGPPFSGQIKPYSTVSELLDDVPPSAVLQLVAATKLEEEPCEEFHDVTMRQVHQMRMPVILEVGLSHIRITSVKAQSISPMPPCKSTEIVSLRDVSDVYNVSTGSGHDPYEFIIRRSRQGITLYFSSPYRDSIVKTIRAAKGHMRDSHAPVAQQFSRFSNVPATLLHVGMLSLDLDDEELRGAAYDLLGAVCTYLNYDKNPIVASKAGFIPYDLTTFIVQLSERLAEFAPELTLDFISEVSAGMEKVGEKGADNGADKGGEKGGEKGEKGAEKGGEKGDKGCEKGCEKTSTAQRINCLQYMSPWIKNLAHFPNPTSPQYEHSGARLRDCIRVLADLTVSDTEISSTIQKYVWREIGKLDSTVVNVVLDELTRAAMDGGIGSRRCEVIARIISGLSSINVRGKLLSRLRRALGRTSLKTSNTLVDNVHWNEIATLIRLILVAGNNSKLMSHTQLYVPEIIHLVTLVAGTGEVLVRKSVYGIIMNLLQSLYISRPEESTCPELLALVNECTQAETLQLFGLARLTASSEYIMFEPSNEKRQIDTQESLTALLVRIMEVAAGSNGLLNVWRARWMSLVTSSAFQMSAAIQTRAFIVIGTLATSDVDDDLLYQMLVAFKTALSHSSETNTTAVVSMLRCICKIIPVLVEHSRYVCQVFWLAVALLQSSHIAFYIEATNLLRATLEYMESRKILQPGSVTAILLDGRTPLEEVACQLDQLLGLSFDSSFSFSLAAIIFKGVRLSGLKDSAEAVLKSLLRITVRGYERENEGTDGYKGILCPDALGYFIALLPLSTTPATFRQLLEDCGLTTAWLPEPGSTEAGVPRVSFEFIGADDPGTCLLLASFIGAILTSAQGDDAETEILFHLLSDIAALYPEIVSMTYEGLQDRIKDTFANSSNPAIIRAVSNIFRVALQDPGRLHSLRGSASTLSTVDEGSTHGPGRNHLLALEELGMQGLASGFQFLPNNRGLATKMINWIPELVIRIIE